MPDAIDWDAIDEEMLKEHKPDLYKALTARSQESESDDDEDEDEEEETEEEAQESQLTARSVENIVMRVFEKIEAKRTTQQSVASKVEGMVNKSTLPDLTKKRVIRSFAGVEKFDENAVKESIEEAKEELAAVGGPRIKNMGPSSKAGSENGSASLGRAHEAVAAAFGMGSKPEKKDSKKEE